MVTDCIGSNQRQSLLTERTRVLRTSVLWRSRRTLMAGCGLPETGYFGMTRVIVASLRFHPCVQLLQYSMTSMATSGLVGTKACNALETDRSLHIAQKHLRAEI